MFRHVVLFRWSEDASADRRAAAIEAVREFGDRVRNLGRLSVGADAGLSDGNFDAGVVVDFERREDYQAYATDPRHQALIAEHLAPILAQRVAVQYEL